MYMYCWSCCLQSTRCHSKPNLHCDTQAFNGMHMCAFVYVAHGYMHGHLGDDSTVHMHSYSAHAQQTIASPSCSLVQYPHCPLWSQSAHYHFYQMLSILLLARIMPCASTCFVHVYLPRHFMLKQKFKHSLCLRCCNLRGYIFGNIQQPV